MEAVVSDIIRSRMQEPGGLKQTAVLSLAAHAIAIGALALVPAMLPARKTAPPIIMNISLGGTPGPRTGGQEMIGGRAIQAAKPSTEPQLAKPSLPAPRQETRMVLPDPKLKPRTPPKNPATSKDPAGTTGRGFETRAGNTPVDTGAKGVGFGLSSGGGGGMGGKLEVTNFCCPEYLTEMTNRIYSRWNQQQQSTGNTFMKFTILRDGRLSDIEVEQSSGNPLLDRASHLALSNTQRINPLPSAFPDDHLIVHLEFKYQRDR